MHPEQLDSFMHALMWKAVPALILAGLAGLLLRELLQWFERSLTRWVELGVTHNKLNHLGILRWDLI